MDPYELNENDQCIAICQDGFRSLLGECVECQDNCKICSSDSRFNCFVCKEDFLISNGQCVPFIEPKFCPVFSSFNPFTLKCECDHHYAFDSAGKC